MTSPYMQYLTTIVADDFGRENEEVTSEVLAFFFFAAVRQKVSNEMRDLKRKYQSIVAALDNKTIYYQVGQKRL